MGRALIFGLLGLAIVGCNPPAAKTEPPPGPAPAAQESPYEKVRSGFYQLDSVAEDLAEAFATAEALAKKPNEARKAAVEALDEAGAQLADLEGPTDPTAFEQDFAGWDDKRLAAITAANDARFLVAEAREAVADDPEAADLVALLELIADDLREAIETLGGKVEEPG